MLWVSAGRRGRRAGGRSSRSTACALHVGACDKRVYGLHRAVLTPHAATARRRASDAVACADGVQLLLYTPTMRRPSWLRVAAMVAVRQRQQPAVVRRAMRDCGTVRTSGV